MIQWKYNISYRSVMNYWVLPKGTEVLNLMAAIVTGAKCSYSRIEETFQGSPLWREGAGQSTSHDAGKSVKSTLQVQCPRLQRRIANLCNLALGHLAGQRS